MEMVNTLDYTMVNPIYKVRAIDAGGMYINPDKQEGRRRQEQQKNLSPPEKEEASVGLAFDYMEVHQQEMEAVRQKEQSKAKEAVPFRLWMYMSGKANQLGAEREENGEGGKKLERFLEEQEKVLVKLAEREVVSFNARA